MCITHASRPMGSCVKGCIKYKTTPKPKKEKKSCASNLNGVVLFVSVGWAHQHAAAVALRRRGAGGAGVAKLLRHGAVGEEGEASATDVVEERGGDAVVGDVEGAPFVAGLVD